MKPFSERTNRHKFRGICMKFLSVVGHWLIDIIFGLSASEKALNKELLKIHEREPSESIPTFKYHHNPLATMSALEWDSDNPQTCDCCGRKTNITCGIFAICFIFNEYSWVKREDIAPECCLYCIANGSAATKFDGKFIDPNASDHPIHDPAKRNELAFRTPSTYSFSPSMWLTCCDDYCTLIDRIYHWHDIEIRNIERKLKKCWLASEGSNIHTFEEVKNALDVGTHIGYLFRCLHCKKYRLYLDKRI